MDELSCRRISKVAHVGSFRWLCYFGRWVWHWLLGGWSSRFLHGLSRGVCSVFCFGYCCPSHSMSAMQRQREYARRGGRERFQAVLPRLSCLQNLMEMPEETLGFMTN